jgi:hypothetical protein
MRILKIRMGHCWTHGLVGVLQVEADELLSERENGAEALREKRLP